jgi:hypothetical protein
MRRVVVATQDGFKPATALAEAGDWAITVRAGSLQTLTHLPTGAVCCSVQSEADYAALPSAMRELDAQAPRFDVQTFEGVKEPLELVLRKHGLRPAWRRK